VEAIFLVCGAGGPQLKRNPLGSTRKPIPCNPSPAPDALIPHGGSVIDEGNTSRAPKTPVADEDPIGALMRGFAASVIFWITWRVVPFLDHRPPFMTLAVGVGVGIGGLVYCIERAKPFLRDRAAREQRRRSGFETLNVLWTESYAPNGRKWIRGAWTSGVLAGALWLAMGLLFDCA
jgi:hypothetical protein